MASGFLTFLGSSSIGEGYRSAEVVLEEIERVRRIAVFSP
jgi:hypothetical protein